MTVRTASQWPVVPATVAGPRPGDCCVTLRQPWASLVMAGNKVLENRSWRTEYRGRLWVAAAASRPAVKSWLDVFEAASADVDLSLPLELPEGGMVPPLGELPRGAVVGSVEVTDCLEVADLPRVLRDRWDAAGPWCWVLARPVALAAPVPCRGKLGLWRF